MGRKNKKMNLQAKEKKIFYKINYEHYLIPIQIYNQMVEADLIPKEVLDALREIKARLVGTIVHFTVGFTSYDGYYILADNGVESFLAYSTCEGYIEKSLGEVRKAL